MIFDVLIIGAGASGMSCALTLGSAHIHTYAKNKKIGIISHQRSSSLQNALFNNVLGITPNTTGESILKNGLLQLTELYPHVDQIANEKVLSVEKIEETILINTNKNKYRTKKVILAVGPKNFNIKGLEKFEELHRYIDPEKNRTQLKNTNHIVNENIYVTGVLAGLRSQFAIAIGSGASVAMDILSDWNNGNPVKIHDSIILP